MLRSFGALDRIRTILAFLLMTAVAACFVTPANARQAAGPEPLDLGAMVLNLADLADFDLEGYRVRGSQAIDTGELANRYAAQLGTDPEGLATAFGETSLVWSFDAALDLVPEPDDPTSVTTDRVYSFVSEHTDADGAAADFTLRTSGSGPAEGLANTDAPVIGEESLLSRFSGQTADDNRLYLIGLDYTFHFDRVVAGVQIIAYANRADRVAEPSQDVAERLARRLLDRVKRGLDGQAPGLSTQVIRVESPSEMDRTGLDMYESLEGDAFPYVGMSDDSLDDLESQIEEYGITARYRVEQPLTSGGDSGDDPSDPYMVLRVSQFASESDAAEWVEEAGARMSSDPSFVSAAVVDDTNSLGDAYVGVAYETEFGDDVVIGGNAVFLQFGTFAFSLEVDNAPLETVTELATKQLECLEDGICLAPIPMPAL